MKRNSGQALVFGLLMIMMFLLVCTYFFTVIELKYKFYYNLNHSKIEKIQEATKYSNILNEISFNNRYILNSIIEIIKDFSSAFEYGSTVSYFQPYWDTYGDNVLDGKNIPISGLSQRKIEAGYKSFSLNTSRNIYIAKSLTEKNKKLISILPLYIRSNFKQLNVGKSNCLAINMISNELKSSNYLKFFVPKTYNHGVENFGCKLVNKQTSINKIVAALIPLFNIRRANIITDFKDFDLFLNLESNSYGLSFVPYINSKNFRNSLKFITDDKLVNNSYSSVFLDFLFKMRFFNKSLGAIKYNPNFVSRKSVVYIEHPKINCGNNILLSPYEDFCTLNENDFLRAFFFPNWSSIFRLQDYEK